MNEKDVQEHENLGRKSDSIITNNTWTTEEDFAEIWLDDEWVKVEILKRDWPSVGIFSVRRLESGKQLEVEVWKLARLGSNEKESLWEIEKQRAYDQVEQLLPRGKGLHNR